MAVEHAIFKFDDLKVTSHYDRQTDRMTTKVLSSHPRINAARPTRVYYGAGHPQKNGSHCMMIIV